jgi:hypothetical protein
MLKNMLKNIHIPPPRMLRLETEAGHTNHFSINAILDQQLPR